MSWIEQAQSGLTITTGDGREYKPLWREPTKLLEFNISVFEFPNVVGSKVSRGTRKGRKIPLEIYFTGEDHIDQADRFEDSANDERHWIVFHPYYGRFNAHPTTIEFDNTGDNVSKISVKLIETIVEDNPKFTVNPSDKIVRDTETLAEKFERSFSVSVPEMSVKGTVLMRNNLDTVYNEGKKRVKFTLDADKYFNLYTSSLSSILNAVTVGTDGPLQAIRSLLAVINYPSQFIDSVRNRVTCLKAQFDLLRSSLGILLTSEDKIIYEKQAAYIVATMAQSSVTNTDYENANDVVEVAEIVMNSFNTLVEDVDGLQTDTGADDNSYVPDFTSMMSLQSLVDYTLSKLISIALDSKQERSIILEYDSNPILLAHRFYGLEQDDSTVEFLIRTNNFGLNDMIHISKGRKIIYYV